MFSLDISRDEVGWLRWVILRGEFGKFGKWASVGYKRIPQISAGASVLAIAPRPIVTPEKRS